MTRPMMANVIRIDQRDNVAVAFREIKAGEPITGIAGLELKAGEDIMTNHKVAIREIPVSSPVIKYGETIGLASEFIRPGDWVHTHNLRAEESD
jgi:hypothetical protein